MVRLLFCSLKADNRFEKWAAEKSKRKERGEPAIVEYRDETYVRALFSRGG